MKKFTLIFTMLTAMLSTQAQDVSNKQWTIMTKTSATWCGNCGSWGWDLFKEIIDDNQEKNVVIWTSHNSGDLDNDASVDINNGWGSFGQPQFFVNSDVISAGPNTTQNARAEINAYIDALLGFSALAGVGVDATYDGTTLSVTGKAEFFTGLEDGNYHLAVYLLKDHIISNQASIGENADHRFVLSDKVTESSFGEQIINGNVDAGASFTINASKEIENVDLENDEVVIILWNLRSDGVYAFFNANRNSIQETGTSNTVDISGVSNITLRQNDSQATLDIQTEQNIGTVLTRLVSIRGQIIKSKSINTTNGSNLVTYNTDNLTPGTYLIQATIDNKLHTEKIIVH